MNGMRDKLGKGGKSWNGLQTTGISSLFRRFLLRSIFSATGNKIRVLDMAMGTKEIQGKVQLVEQKKAATDVAGKSYLNLQLCFSVK